MSHSDPREIAPAPSPYQATQCTLPQGLKPSFEVVPYGTTESRALTRGEARLITGAVKDRAVTQNIVSTKSRALTQNRRSRGLTRGEARLLDGPIKDRALTQNIVSTKSRALTRNRRSRALTRGEHSPTSSAICAAVPFSIARSEEATC